VGSAVITQTLPKAKDVLNISLGQILNRWEMSQESKVVGYTLINPGLLQKDFGKPDRVGIARSSPRQIPTMNGVPIH